jgi:hypothetical protein
MPRPLGVLLAVALSAGSALPARALLILDDFEEGAFSLAAPPDSFDTQSGLGTTHVAAGSRQVSLQTSVGAGVTATLTLTGADDAAVLATSGAVGTTSLSFIYDFAAPVDLTASGDRIEIVFSGSGVGGALTVSVLDTGSNFEGIQAPGGALTGPLLAVPLSSFTVANVASINRIGITLTTTGGIGSVSISEIRLVPEPALALLLSVAAIGLRLRRRSSTS